MAGKRYENAVENIDHQKRYDLEEALKLVGANKVASFDETVEMAVRLNVDPRQADQNVRGTYRLTVGPNVTDTSGNPMNQNGNAVNGEPGDAYSGTVTLAPTSCVTESKLNPLSLPPAIRTTGVTWDSSALIKASRLVALESLMNRTPPLSPTFSHR